MVGSCGKVLPALDKNLPPLVTPTVSEFHGQRRGQLCGDWCCTQIKELNVSVPDNILPHPKVYCQTVGPNNTSPETDRTKDKKGRKAVAKKRQEAKNQRMEKHAAKEEMKFVSNALPNLPRSRGGAGGGSMVHTGIEVAAHPGHGVSLHHEIGRKR